MNQTHSAK